jgi:hypothetical protein
MCIDAGVKHDLQFETFKLCVPKQMILKHSGGHSYSRTSGMTDLLRCHHHMTFDAPKTQDLHSTDPTKISCLLSAVTGTGPNDKFTSDFLAMMD